MERTFGSEDFKDMPRFYRANLINSATGLKPAMLLGSINAAGLTNLALFSSVFHIGSDPALVGFIQRPVGRSGDSFRNITATRVYTLNHVHREFLLKAHYTSAHFPADTSEFETCQLTPQYLDGFAAPFVRESRLKLGLSLVETIPIPHNGTHLVIGKVECLLAGEDLLSEDGHLKLAEAGDVAVAGLEHYHEAGWLQALGYAHADQLPVF